MSSSFSNSSKSALIKERGSLLESLLEDSNRLAPLTLALLDDLASRASMAAYRRHLIRRWAEGGGGGDQLKKRQQPSKHLTILCLEEVDKEAFVAANRIGSTANVLLLDADDIGPEEEILKSEHILKELAAQGRAQSLSSDSSSSSPSSRDSVLVIDSVVPLLMEAMSSGSRNRTSKQVEQQQDSSVQAATKAVAAWLGRLHQPPRPFSHVVFTLHTDVFSGASSSSHQYIELALSHLSNAVIDFRPRAGLPSDFQRSCPLVKLLSSETKTGDEGQNSSSGGSSISSVHVQVLARRKHPRTHLKVTRRHEHLQLELKSGGRITRFLSGEELAKVAMMQLQQQQQKDQSTKESETTTITSTTTTPLPESTFNLTLKREEQEAKDSLVLPYTRKSQTNTGGTAANTGAGGGGGGGGQIVYHYDQFDDFDEDDPDDDLDF